jgi:hypothetical protein
MPIAEAASTKAMMKGILTSFIPHAEHKLCPTMALKEIKNAEGISSALIY